MLVKFVDCRTEAGLWVNPLQVRTVRAIEAWRDVYRVKQGTTVTVVTLASESSGPAGGSSGSPEVWVIDPVEDVVRALDAALSTRRM